MSFSKLVWITWPGNTQEQFCVWGLLHLLPKCCSDPRDPALGFLWPWFPGPQGRQSTPPRSGSRVRPVRRAARSPPTPTPRRPQAESWQGAGTARVLKPRGAPGHWAPRQGSQVLRSPRGRRPECRWLWLQVCWPTSPVWQPRTKSEGGARSESQASLGVPAD